MPLPFVRREILSPKLTVTVEFELNDSTLSAEDAANAIQRAIDNGYGKYVSEFIVFLMRETRSSTWELKKVKVT